MNNESRVSGTFELGRQTGLRPNRKTRTFQRFSKSIPKIQLSVADCTVTFYKIG